MRRILVVSDHQHRKTTRNQAISKNHSITIWDQCGTIPEGEFGYNWSGYKDTGGGLSLLRLLEEYSDELRGRFFHLRADFLSRLAQTFHSFSSQTNIETFLDVEGMLPLCGLHLCISHRWGCTTHRAKIGRRPKRSLEPT